MAGIYILQSKSSLSEHRKQLIQLMRPVTHAQDWYVIQRSSDMELFPFTVLTWKALVGGNGKMWNAENLRRVFRGIVPHHHSAKYPSQIFRIPHIALYPWPRVGL